MKVFLFEAWIHPKNGGDDFLTELTVDAKTFRKAKNLVEKYLAKRSDIINDYALKASWAK